LISVPVRPEYFPFLFSSFCPSSFRFEAPLCFPPRFCLLLSTLFCTLLFFSSLGTLVTSSPAGPRCFSGSGRSPFYICFPPFFCLLSPPTVALAKFPFLFFVALSCASHSVGLSRPYKSLPFPVAETSPRPPLRLVFVSNQFVAALLRKKFCFTPFFAP